MPLRDDPENKFGLSPADCLIRRPLLAVPEPIVPDFPSGILATSVWLHTTFSPLETVFGQAMCAGNRQSRKGPL